MEHSFKELPFLDILIKNQNAQIITDIYHKPTDTQQYNLLKSHHPQKLHKIHPLHLNKQIMHHSHKQKNLQQTHLEE